MKENYFPNLTKKELNQETIVYVSIPIIVYTVTLPFLSYFIKLNKKGKEMNFLSGIVALVTFGMLPIGVSIVVPLILVGLAFSIFSGAIWPTLIEMVDSKQVVAK